MTPRLWGCIRQSCVLCCGFARTYRYVHHLEPERVADQVVGQHDGALQARVGPSARVGVGNVQLGDGDGVDLVGRLGHGALHRLLVLVRENRRHGGGVFGRLKVAMRVVVRGKMLKCPAVGLGRGWWGVLLTPLLGSTWEQSQSLGKPVEAACLGGMLVVCCAELATVLVRRMAVLVKGRRHLRLTSRLGGQRRNPSNAFCPVRFADPTAPLFPDNYPNSS
jgi:hypothetical protein